MRRPPKQPRSTRPDLAGVRYLRSVADADELRRDAAAASRVVVIGAGWIGAEVGRTAPRAPRRLLGSSAIRARHPAHGSSRTALLNLCGRLLAPQRGGSPCPAQAEDWCGEIAASGLDRRLAPPAQCPAMQGIRHPVPRPSVAQLFLHRRRGRYLAVIAQDRSRCRSTGQPSTAQCGPTPDRREPMQGGQSRATPDPPRSGSHHVDVGIGRRLGGDGKG
jgi:hypothetical protein